MKTSPSNIELVGEKYGRWFVKCEMGDHRYHLWLEEGSLEPENDVVYKNPIDRTERRSPTIRLDRNRGTGKLVADAMLARIPELRSGAEAKLQAMLKQEAEEQEAFRKEMLAKGAGPELLQALRRLVQGLEDGEPISELLLQARPVIARASGEAS